MMSYVQGGLPPFALGVMLGVVGFIPMALACTLVRKGSIRPSVGKGLAAIAVSWTFLMLVIAFGWLIAADTLVALTFGVLLGFFAACAVVIVTERSGRPTT